LIIFYIITFIDLRVDNSDWSRNGDYLPTRWEAQQDAVALIANAKFQAHAESSVGLMTMAGKQ
jgi:26S proteasome regulatory subunit N10